MILASCCRKRKKSQWQETGQGTSEDIWTIYRIPNWLYMGMSGHLDYLGSIGYHSESSDVPYSRNHFLVLDFFCRFLQQDCSNYNCVYFLTGISVQKYMKPPTRPRLFIRPCHLLVPRRRYLTNILNNAKPIR